IWGYGSAASGRTLVVDGRRALPEHVGRDGSGIDTGVHDPYRFLGHLPVHDAERADLRGFRVAGRHQQVVRVRVAGDVHVGPRRVCLGRGVRVVDDDRFLVAVVHLRPHPQLLGRVEPVERRGPLRVVQRYVPDRLVRTDRARDDPARLVGVVPAGVRDDRVDDVTPDGQHGSQAYPATTRPRGPPVAGITPAGITPAPHGPPGSWTQVPPARGTDVQDLPAVAAGPGLAARAGRARRGPQPMIASSRD